jgi:biotin transport system substrate-specific component
MSWQEYYLGTKLTALSEIMLTENKTLYQALFKQRSMFLDIFMVLCSVAFLGVMANITIPLWPVPVTMQTFGVFLIAFFFGSREGFFAILAYIIAGIAGIGLFTGYNSGFGVLLGPTGGYIIGFLLMALFVGQMIEKGYGRSKRSVLLCMFVGEIILYIFGLAGLWLYLGDVSFIEVLMLGFVPFILGDLIKIAGAVALFPYLWKKSEELTDNY